MSSFGSCTRHGDYEDNAFDPYGCPACAHVQRVIASVIELSEQDLEWVARAMRGHKRWLTSERNKLTKADAELLREAAAYVGIVDIIVKLRARADELDPPPKEPWERVREDE